VLLQTGVLPPHAALATQLPLGLHVSGVVRPAPPHRVLPGTQSPVQLPTLQTKGQGLMALTYVAVGLRVWGVRGFRGSHRAAPGAHSPLQEPPTQV